MYAYTSYILHKLLIHGVKTLWRIGMFLTLLYFRRFGRIGKYLDTKIHVQKSVLKWGQLSQSAQVVANIPVLQDAFLGRFPARANTESAQSA